MSFKFYPFFFKFSTVFLLLPALLSPVCILPFIPCFQHHFVSIATQDLLLLVVHSFSACCATESGLPLPFHLIDSVTHFWTCPCLLFFFFSFCLQLLISLFPSNILFLTWPIYYLQPLCIALQDAAIKNKNNNNNIINIGMTFTARMWNILKLAGVVPEWQFQAQMEKILLLLLSLNGTWLLSIVLKIPFLWALCHI